MQLIGWRNNKPHKLKNVKMSFAGTVRIKNTIIDIRHLYLGRLISIQIGKNDIESISIYDNDNDLVEVDFQNTRMNKIMQFLLKGAPFGKVFLNLGKSKNEFMEIAEKWQPTNKSV